MYLKYINLVFIRKIISHIYHDYKTYNQRKDATLQDDIYSGFFRVTDDEIIYLVRRSKHDLDRYKLVKYDMTTGTTVTHPTNPEEFLEFKNMEIYGFTMHKFPTIDGILAVVSEFSRLQISYIELDATTQKERKRNLIFEQENTSPPELDAMIHLKVNVEDIDPANGHYNIFFEESGIYTKFSSEANISGGNKCYLVKYSTKYKKVLFMRSGEERNDINHIQNSIVLDNGNFMTVSIGIKGEEKRDIQNTDYSEQNPIEFHEPCIAVYSSRSLIWEGCYGTKFSTKQVYSDIHANRVYLLWQEFDIVNDAMENIVLKVVDQDTGLELLRPIF